jgi:serine/threonine protein kinase
VGDAPISSRTPPTRVGRYAIYGQFAKGGTATVHFGRLVGPGGFARTVAIKRLRPSFVDEPEFTRMLIDEARLVARISHQCVVPTLDVLVYRSVTYIVMEYTRGVPLSLLFARARARGQRMDPCIVAAVVANALHGLHAAHEARDELGRNLGIVHRDVSPQNILVGVDGVARVLDFGIAKAVTATQATRSGYVKGKFAYMAPEQLAGTNVDRRADVFATTVVLWELLTGERLFGGGSITGAIKKITRGRDEPPSSYASQVGAEWDALTLRGLQRDKELRFATAREMALELEASSPMAPASEIGEWVLDLAGDVLAARDAELREIEALSTTDPESPADDADEVTSATGFGGPSSRGGEATQVDFAGPVDAGAEPSVELLSRDSDGAGAEEEVAADAADGADAPIGVAPRIGTTGEGDGPEADAGAEDAEPEGDASADEGADSESESESDDAPEDDAAEGDPGGDDAPEDGASGGDDDDEDDEEDDDDEEAGDEDPRYEDTLRFRIQQGATMLLGLATILLALSFGVEHLTGKPVSVLIGAWLPFRGATPGEESTQSAPAPTAPAPTSPGTLSPPATPTAPVEAADAGTTGDRRTAASPSEGMRDMPQRAAGESSPVVEAPAKTARRADRLATRRSEKVNCDPPYEVDTAGVTIFKLGCL